MKKKICLVLLCAFTVLCFAQSRKTKLPALEGAKFIDNNSFNKKAKHNIVLVNYSSLDVIDIDFFVLEEGEKTWNFVGNLNKCDFAKEIKLNPKIKMRNAEYIAYKAELPNNIELFADVRNNDMYFFILEKSNKVLGRTVSFGKIKDSVDEGLYKFDATVQARKYEDNIRVKNAPKCIIMAVSPELGTWEVVGYVDRGKFKKLFKGDIDELSTSWVIQVLERDRDYTVTAYAKHDDLYISFTRNGGFEYEEDYEVEAEYDEDYEVEEESSYENDYDDSEVVVFDPARIVENPNVVEINGKYYYKLNVSGWGTCIDFDQKYDLPSHKNISVDFLIEDSDSNQVVGFFSDGSSNVGKVVSIYKSGVAENLSSAFGSAGNFTEDTNYDGTVDYYCSSSSLKRLQVFVQETTNWTPLDVIVYVGTVTVTK